MRMNMKFLSTLLHDIYFYKRLFWPSPNNIPERSPAFSGTKDPPPGVYFINQVF